MVFLYHGNLVERIALHGDEVGEFAGLEWASLIGDAEEVGGVYVFLAVLFFKFGGLSTLPRKGYSESFRERAAGRRPTPE